MGRLFNATETADIDGHTYTLAIDIEIIDQIEDDVGCGFLDLMGQMGGDGKERQGAKRNAPKQAAPKQGAGGMRIGKMSKVVRGLLLRHHPEITLNEAGSLFLGHGDEVAVALDNLFVKAWPDAETKGTPPRKARRGTGKSSSSNGARKVSRRQTSSDRRPELSA